MTNPTDDTTYRVTADELRQFIERIERIAAEKSDLTEQNKEVFEELAGRGYDKKAVRQIVARRKRDADDLAEEDAKTEHYKTVLGMA